MAKREPNWDSGRGLPKDFVYLMRKARTVNFGGITPEERETLRAWLTLLELNEDPSDRFYKLYNAGPFEEKTLFLQRTARWRDFRNFLGI